MTQTEILEDLQETEDSPAPVVNFQAFKFAKKADEEARKQLEKTDSMNKAMIGPYSRRYPHHGTCCPCPHYPFPLWPAYPQYPWHFPQPYYPDWTYRPYPAYPGVYCGTGTAPVH